jgi:hypothetical protein
MFRMSPFQRASHAVYSVHLRTPKLLSWRMCWAYDVRIQAVDRPTLSRHSLALLRRHAQDKARGNQNHNQGGDPYTLIWGVSLPAFGLVYAISVSAASTTSQVGICSVLPLTYIVHNIVDVSYSSSIYALMLIYRDVCELHEEEQKLLLEISGDDLSKMNSSTSKPKMHSKNVE